MSGWIPIRWHNITDEERAINGYREEQKIVFDCKMPKNDQTILVSTRPKPDEKPTVIRDICYIHDKYKYVLCSGSDWIDDIAAWQPFPPLPEPYKGIMTIRNLINDLTKYAETSEKGFDTEVRSYVSMSRELAEKRLRVCESGPDSPVFDDFLPIRYIGEMSGFVYIVSKDPRLD